MRPGAVLAEALHRGASFRANPMTPDPERKPSREEKRQSGMVATAVLVFLAIFTTVIIWIA